jgi:Pyruvate/2-oxoacid:ferredoxin oxidoreductase delta subunit/thioredoxin reductase
VRPGMDYLHEVRAGGRGHTGRRVVVVGGSETAVDCARTALRLGCEPTVLFAGAREEMAADSGTVEEALREGVRFEFFTRVVGLQVSEHADEEQAIEAIRHMFDSGETPAQGTRLVGVACVRLQPEQAAADGSRRTLSVPGSSFVLPADTLLTAPGGEAEEAALPPDLRRRGYILKTDEFGHTSREGFFAGGDLSGEPRTVAHALGSGKRAAIGIDRWLRTKAGDAVPALVPQALRYGGTGAMSVTRWRGDDPVRRTNELNEVVAFEQLNMAYFTHVPSTPDHHRAPGQSGSDFGEANLGLAPDEALGEAKRCFNCGVCTDCELCLIYCPDVAIKRHSSGHGFSLSYKYCKGCGLCVSECPRGAMTMTREGL